MELSSISERFNAVRQRVEDACRRSGRGPETVTLIAVTKQRSIEEIKEVLRSGATNIGENYVQEAVAKFETIGASATWHFIGHLQRNKVRSAIEVADLIHAVDSVRVGQEISRRAQANEKTQRALLEVSISCEATESGLMEQDAGEVARVLCALPGLRLEGLMTMAPYTEDLESVRHVFSRTRQLANSLASEGLLPEQPTLSMGMTGDFEVAIEEGATMVRIGTAIFGHRHIS